MITISIDDSRVMYKKNARSVSIENISYDKICASRGWMYGDGRIEHYELIFVRKGAVSVYANGRQYTVSENMYLILRPGSRIKGSRPSESETEFLRLRFSVQGVDESKFANLCGQLSNMYVTALIWDGLMRIGETDKHSADLYTALILNEIGLERKREENAGAKIAESVIKKIKTDADARLCVAGVAEEMGYNKDYLCKIFKKHCGMTIKEYIDRELVSRAETLLTASSYQISEIADILCFSSANLFNKFFKYHRGMSPTEFRRR